MSAVEEDVAAEEEEEEPRSSLLLQSSTHATTAVTPRGFEERSQRNLDMKPFMAGEKATKT